jgi:hypothetical protein
MRRRRHPRREGLWLAIAVALALVVSGMLTAAYLTSP